MSSRQKIVKRIDMLRDAITLLDSVRIGFYIDITSLEKNLSELKLKDTPLSVERIVEEARAILSIPLRAPEFSRLKKLNRLASVLLVIGFLSLITSMAMVFFLEFSYFLYTLLLVIALVCVNASYFLRLYVSHRIVKIYVRNKSELEERGRVLKQAIEYLLTKLRDEVRKLGLNPTNYTIELRNTDYKGLKVIKRPGVFRSTYVLTFKR